MKVFLANDTSRSRHAGCQAVMRSLHAALAAVPDLQVTGRQFSGDMALDEDAFLAADALVINGEGTLHHGRERALFLLEVLAEGKRMGKKVLLVNALFQEYACSADDLLADLALLAVREPRSAAFARCYGGAPVVLLDSAADPQFLEGGTAMALRHGCVVGGGISSALLKDPFRGIEGHPLTMADGRFEDIIATLRGADVYLTAQHHGVYAAALAGCPFVACPSNSHKIEAFIAWTGLPIPLCLRAEEVEPSMVFARRNPSIFAELQAFMHSQSVLTSAMLADALR